MKNKLYPILIKLLGRNYTYLGCVQYTKDDDMNVLRWLKPKTVKELTDNRAC